MGNLQAGDVLDAAAKTLANERCLHAYIHDMRGGLQAIYSSVELLARSAKLNTTNAALIDGAASIAKRALEHHEKTIVAILNQMSRTKETPKAVNLAAVIKETQQFLRNDTLNKSITIRVSGGEDLFVLSDHNALRSQISGVLVMAIDALPSGAELNIELSNSDGKALLELCSELNYQAIPGAEVLFRPEAANIKPLQLVLASFEQWIATHGGRVEIPTQSGTPHGLRIYYPLTSA